MSGWSPFASEEILGWRRGRESFLGQVTRITFRFHDANACRFQLLVVRFLVMLQSHFFENPARARPNRTLGGTNCKDDKAPVRSSISVSAFL